MSLHAHEVENKFLWRIREVGVSGRSIHLTNKCTKMQGSLHFLILTYMAPLANAEVIVW